MNTIYQCEVCDFTSLRIDEVTLHMQIHTDTEENADTGFWRDAHSVSVCEIENSNSIETNDLTNNEDADNFVWSQNVTKLLIEQYKILKPMVEIGKVKSAKKMWERIEETLLSHGYKFSIKQIENKWKSLERSYKNAQDNKNKTGRGRKSCPFERELDEILSKRHSLNPEFVLESSTSSSDKNPHISEMESTESPRSTPDRRLAIKRKAENGSVVGELKLLRQAFEERNNLKKEAEEKKNRQRDELIEQLKTKNDLLQEILRKMI